MCSALGWWHGRFWPEGALYYLTSRKMLLACLSSMLWPEVGTYTCISRYSDCYYFYGVTLFLLLMALNPLLTCVNAGARPYKLANTPKVVTEMMDW